MKNNNVFKAGFLIFLIAATVWPQYPATYYPDVDKSSHWTVGSFGNGELYQVHKTIRTSASTTEDRCVFWSLKFLKLFDGINTYYTVTPSYEYTQQFDGFYKECAGWYNVNGTNWQIFISFRLWQSGYIDILASWSQNWPSNHYNFSFGFEADYDLAGADDDIVEYQKTQNNVQQWYAPANAGWTPHFDGTLITSTTGPLDGNWLVRCVDATSPANQLQLFFGSRFNSIFRHDFYLRTYASSSGTLQDVYNDTYNLYQQYAYGGRDQKMEIWVATYNSTLSPDNLYYKSVSGLLVQKPNGRSLNIQTYVMTGAATPNVYLTVDNGRKVAHALNDLTNSHWTNYLQTNLPDPYTGDMTWSQLHDFMTTRRMYGPVYTCDAQNNMRDWKVEMIVVNHRLTPAATGVMFDYTSSDRLYPGADMNNVHREGAAISWPTCVGWHNLVPSWSADRFLAFVFIHEMGHCFNMLHLWSDCDEDFDSDNCQTAKRTIMSYGPMRAGGSTTMTWSDNNRNWYQLGPESWVKPGRFGARWTSFYGYLGAPPAYQQY